MEVISELQGPVMVRNGGTWSVVMIADEVDRVRFMLNGWPLGADRGFGRWCSKRYWSAASNSMHPSR